MNDLRITEAAPVLHYRNRSADAPADPWWLELAITLFAWVVMLGGSALIALVLIGA